MARPVSQDQTSAVYRKALALAEPEQRRRWIKAWSIPRGMYFWIVPGDEAENRRRMKKGEPPIAHHTAIDGHGCTCEGFRRSRGRGICSHSLAAQIVYDEEHPDPSLATEEEVSAHIQEAIQCRACGSAPRVGLSKLCAECQRRAAERFERLCANGRD